MQIWSLSDDKAGNRRQADALAAALAQRLALSWQSICVTPRAPWRLFAPRWLPGAASRFDPQLSRRLRESRPRLVIGCGRQAALATRIACHFGAAHSVQILDPRLPAAHWSLRVQPQHDPHRDERTLLTLGSLNPIDDAWLQAARAEQPELESLPRPRMAFLLGGPTKGCAWDGADLRRWWRAALDYREQRGGSLVLIASRRTPSNFRSELGADADRQWWSENDGDNPYASMLGWADELWVSPDSVNMLSEAAATRARVVLLPSPGATGRIAAFHAGLRASGRVENLDALPVAWPVQPLREVAQIADAVIDRLQLAADSAAPVAG